MMTIGLCSDHTGVEYKARLAKWLRERGFDVTDFGTDSTDSCDYPDYAHKLAHAVAEGRVQRGIAFCGTGNGMAITLNHHSGIRAGLAWNTMTARLAKAHNDANILVMPARYISWRMVAMATRVWLETPFEGGRHERRINKIEQGL